MYAIISEGKIVSLCDYPRYIRRKEETGVNVDADKASAQGVAVAGTVYNLPGKNVFPDAKTAIVTRNDGGEYVFRAQKDIEENTTVNGIVFVTMAESGQIDDVTAAEHPGLFEHWSYPVEYKAGQLRVDPNDGALYRCIQPHTSQEDWNPAAAVSLWTKAADPAEEWPEWSQPVGAHDAYNKGDKVTYKGRHFISLIDANIYTPTVHGWQDADRYGVDI